MASATVTRPRQTAAEKRMVLARVSWETYKRLLADDVERRVPRISYDQGVMELVTPSMPHEEDVLAIARIVEILCAVLGRPIRSVGSTTFRRIDLERGFEPNASFYIQHEERIRGQREVDLSVDPPPDLVLEMEMSRSALDKLALFASMGIPEVWRYDGHRVTIFVLDRGRCREAAASSVLPHVTGEVLNQFLETSRTMLSPDWFHAVTDWARSQRPEPR